MSSALMPLQPLLKPRWRRIRRPDIFLAVFLASVTWLTLWQLQRSEALGEALAAYEGHRAPLSVHTLWETLRRSWADGVWNKGGGTGTGRPDTLLTLRRALDHLDRHPRDPRAARLAGLGLTKLEYPVEAEPYYTIARRAHLLTRDDISTRLLGLARGNLRDLAIESCKELLESQPDDAGTLQRLATIYYSQKRLKLAIETAERLSKAPEGAVAGYALIGIIHHDDHRTEQAVAANERVLELDPELKTIALPSSLFFADFAQDLIDLDRPADARRHLQRALKQGDDPPLLNLLGVTYEREGQHDEAVSCWKRAIELDPNFSRPWLNLGLQALEANRLEEAVISLERATSLDGASLEPTYQLSLAYRRVGRTADAERLRKKADRIRAAAEPSLAKPRSSESSP